MPTKKKSTRKSIARKKSGDANAIVRILKKTYPDAVCALTHRTPLQLLIATILSAQCTDERVNIVTKDLFKKYKTAEDFARADLEELEQMIKSTGFFRQKAKSIQACCTDLVEKYDGEIPQDMEALVKMRGVGRKTANVVLGTAFGISTGVVVDTHVKRLSNRMGLTNQKDPEKIEKDLMEQLPRKEWINFSHRMIHHGRRICMARKPKCDLCPVERVCPKVGVA